MGGMPLPPWAAGPSSDPTTARVREEVCRILLGAGPVPVTAVLSVLRRTTGPDVPPVEWLVAALLGDRRLWRLPDGRWLHLPSAIDGRLLTCQPTAAALAVGVLAVDLDVATALLPFRGWDRVPVAGAGARGLAERARTPGGRAVLVIPVGVVPPLGDGLLALRPGPEGLDLASATVDEVADLRARQVLGDLLTVHDLPAREDHVGSADGPGDGMAAWPRRWSPADVDLVRMARDPDARRTAERPLSAQLAGVAEADPAATLVGA